MELFDVVPPLWPFTLQSVTLYGCLLLGLIGMIISLVIIRREVTLAKPRPGSVLREQYHRTLTSTSATLQGKRRRSERIQFDRQR
jgi:hypothetical protein